MELKAQSPFDGHNTMYVSFEKAQLRTMEGWGGATLTCPLESLAKIGNSASIC